MKPSAEHWAEPVALAPVQHWLAAMRDHGCNATDHLGAAYRDNPPTQGELIFTGACEFTCLHCVYPPSFARHNRPMPVTNWQAMLKDIQQGLSINTFVYGGRSVTQEGIDAMAWLRRFSPSAQIGLIDNGISMLPNRDRLHDIKADWIDISLDGQEAAHDLQRGRIGSYRAGLEGARWLVREGLAPKINILTCLTSLNRHAVVPMIRDLNAEGFRNFFVTPVTLVPDTHLSPELELSPEEIAGIIEELRQCMDSLDEAWLEFTMFSERYASAVANFAPEVWAGLQPEREGLSWRSAASQGASELWVRYYPASLTGTRELIINTKGDVITPKSMAYGKVPQPRIFGNLMRTKANDLWRRLPELSAFGYYEAELKAELNSLREYF